ncbi:MAG: mercuric transporter MerT family protein [Wenzhouxiangella sp.]
MTDSMNSSVEPAPAEPGSSANEKGLLALGGLGAVIASACCILPFVLVMLGLGGAWLANLHALYPYRWIFIGAAAVALFFAWRRLYRTQAECAEGEVCAVPTVKRAYRVLFWVIAGLVALSAVGPHLLGALLS